MAQLKKHAWFLGAIGLWLIIIIFVQWSYRNQNIAVVQQVQTVQKRTITSEYQNQDTQITQRLKLKLVKGPLKQQQVQLSNTYYQSQADSNQYHRYDYVILSPGRHVQHLTLLNPKRDNIVWLLLAIVILSLLGLLKNHGARALLSAVVNCSLFAGLLLLATHWQNQHILFLTIILTILATLLTLGIIFGYSRQTIIASSATILSTFLALGVSVLVLVGTHSQGIHYETLAYGIQPFQVIFLAETLLGVLGACMDETTDITASVYQLLQEQPTITQQQLFTSGLTVGREIIGPLINILFYLFLAELIPLVVLYLRNGNTLNFALSRTMTLEYTQTVISALGIVLAVPITAFLAAKLLRGEA
ncbi:MAG: YibE/F family protein [Lactobacillus sp.]|uniref:YibE/F family protein n=1 Tax=Bombilactobacillus bombi TaxID=1303590 RepID=UPI0035E6A13C|nr:YibE/F family protein [Lactobacillus sp.]